MAGITGRSGQFGIAAESAFGTGVAADHFYPVESAGVDYKPVRLQGTGIQAGLLGEDYARFITAGYNADGKAVIPHLHKGKFPLLWKMIMGSISGPTQCDATAAYTSTSTLTLAQPFFTAQVGVPEGTGTVKPYNSLGSKITSAELSCAAGEEAKLTLEWDAQTVAETPTLASASYTAGAFGWSWAQCTIKIGTYNSEVAVTGIKGFSLKIDRSLATDRHYAGAAGLKAEQQPNGAPRITGTLKTDYLDKTKFVDQFRDKTSTSLVILFEGATIATTYKETLKIVVPLVFFTGTTPGLDGEDMISPDIPFEWKYDGTNAPAVTIIDTGVTL